MNPASTETKLDHHALFCDADFPLCPSLRRRLHRLLHKRGFVCIPLQTPASAARRPIPAASLADGMKVQLADGRVLGGVDAWSYLLRSIWWLFPLGFLISLPGCDALTEACYQFIARHPCGFGGKCSLRGRRHRRTIPFLDLP